MDSKEIENDEKEKKSNDNNSLNENFNNKVIIISSNNNNNQESEENDQDHDLKKYEENTIQKIYIEKPGIYIDKYDRYDSDGYVNSKSQYNNCNRCCIY